MFRAKRLRRWTVMAGAVALLLAQSCTASKNCGCGSDLNRNYKTPRQHR